MDMSMGTGGGGSSLAPLNASGVDFSNETQAFNFLQEILDDSELQIFGKQYARYFWYGVVVVIGIASILNFTQKLTLKARLRAAAANKVRPARPQHILMKTIATTTAIYRESSYPHWSPDRRALWLKVPPLGTIILLSIYLAFVLSLEFIQNDIPGAQHYTAIGVRAAWLAVAQVPLLILLVGKNNLISLFTGVSYERLNLLHRWVSRVLLLLATIHFGSQSYGWNQYGLMQLEWETDTCPPTGIAAYAILLWLNLSTLAPFRNWCYEFFVIQHIITFFGFIIAVMFHLPSTALYSRVYIYIPIALYLVDRLLRALWYTYHNIRPARATLQAMDGITKIRIKNKQIKRWNPGSHVLLSIPGLGFGQSHPATIASIPTSHDGDLIFVWKSHQGFTNTVYKSAMSSRTSLLPSSEKEVADSPKIYTALIDGPYGGMQADFAAFDTVVLIAGSTGVTFTLSLLLDIAHRASSQKLPVRRLEFVWIIKNTSWTSWISDELLSAFRDIEATGIEIAIKIFVTCDNKFTDADEEIKECGCECDKSLGPCCCTNIDEDEENDVVTMVGNGEKAKPVAIATSSTSPTSLAEGRPKKNPKNIFSAATFQSGRPAIDRMVWDAAEQAEGEMGIAVCGPMGLSSSVRTTVAKISDERAVHKGTGAQGICLHVESFCW